MKWLKVTKLTYVLAFTALAVSLGAVAGPVVWRLSGQKTTTALVVPTDGAALPFAPSQRPDISSVLAANPFGSAILPETPAVAVGETSLGYTLLGVTLANPAENSRAMIADASAVAQSYAVGAELSSGVTVTTIQSDHVVLTVNGALQTLSFPNAIASAVPAVEQSPVNSGVAALNRLVPDKVSYFESDLAEATDADSVIARYRAAIRLNPISVMLRLGVEATTGGYLVKQETSQGVLNAGFRPGDVIKMVNGKKVGNLQSDVDLFDQIASAGLAQVQVVRNGELLKLSFPFR